MKNIKWFALILILTHNVLAHANDDIEIDGLVIAQTKTKVGKDFHRLFMTIWTGPRGIQGYNIIIKEQISARNGNAIIIEVNDRAVFSNTIQTRSQDLEDVVKRSVNVLKDHLYSLSINGPSTNPDLAESGL